VQHLSHQTGHLRLWGNWTGGRPGETAYKLVACEAAEDCLRFRFDGGEALAVWSPVGISINEMEFWIANASAMRWTYSHYGDRSRTPRLYYKDYARQDGGIVYRTNAETTRGMGWLNTAISFPAVEMPSSTDVDLDNSPVVKA
jgi:hypothetical protein